MTHYQEVQRLQDTPFAWPIGAVVGLVSALTAAGLLPDTGAAVAALIPGALVLVLLFVGPMKVVVGDGEVRVDWFPLMRKRIPLAQVESAEPRRYRPLREYGGWGIRFGLGRSGKAYTVSGDRGVQLELTGGRRVLIGSHHPEDLAEAIRSAEGFPTGWAPPDGENSGSPPWTRST